MLSTTVHDIIQGDWNRVDPNDEPFCIYLIRDEDTVLYIGKSSDPFGRLLAHFDSSWRGSGSVLGPFYKQHTEEAACWVIELYTLDDCEPFIMQHLPLPLSVLHNPIHHDSCVNRAEKAMIIQYNPCLNDRNNATPSSLPEKYNKKLNLDNNAVDYIKL